MNSTLPNWLKKDTETYIKHIPEQEIFVYIPMNQMSFIDLFKLFSFKQLIMQTLSRRKNKLVSEVWYILFFLLENMTIYLIIQYTSIYDNIFPLKS